MNVEDIKYKAYVKELNKIFNVELMELCNTCGVSCVTVAHNSTDDLVQYDTDEVILLPFTGFHDKNGKEIYEGDIIADNEDGEYTVGRDNKTASFRLIDENNTVTTGRMLHERFIKEYEILGNVWENPELLKE